MAGAGVTISAVDDPATSWSGLIRSGAERVVDLDPSRDKSWLRETLRLLKSKQLAEWLEAAQRVSDALRAMAGNQFGKWLEDTAGSFNERVRSPSLPELLGEFQLPIATTNYDDVLTSLTGREHVTYRNPQRFQAELRRPGKYILHLHGHWTEPDTVVFGYTSYEDVLGDVASQAILRSLAAVQQLVFVGFGDGLSDPNFSALGTWLKTKLPDNENQPIVLSRTANVKALEILGRQRGFSVIDVGATFADLELYLARLLRDATDSIGLSNEAPITYDWPSLSTKLNRLARRIERHSLPDLVLTMSGPGSFAAGYCLAQFSHDPPLIVAVTFPKKPHVSAAADRFGELASAAGWLHIETSRWQIFIPGIIRDFGPGTRALILDDRVVGGNSQRQVAQLLRDLEYEVTTAALVAHPDRVTAGDVDIYEERTDRDFTFPWGSKYGRNEPPV